MSVRAYRLIKKEVAEDSSFNLWHDDELIDFLKSQPDVNGIESYTERLDDGGGEVVVSIYALQKAVKGFKWEKDDYRLKSIKKDIEFAVKLKDDYVVYECF